MENQLLVSLRKTDVYACTFKVNCISIPYLFDFGKKLRCDLISQYAGTMLYVVFIKSFSIFNQTCSRKVVVLRI